MRPFRALTASTRRADRSNNAVRSTRREGTKGLGGNGRGTQRAAHDDRGRTRTHWLTAHRGKPKPGPTLAPRGMRTTDGNCRLEQRLRRRRLVPPSEPASAGARDYKRTALGRLFAVVASESLRSVAMTAYADGQVPDPTRPADPIPPAPNPLPPDPTAPPDPEPPTPTPQPPRPLPTD